MRGRGWFLLGGLALIVALLVLLRGPAGAGDSPEHRSTSDASNGTSALRLFAEALGHPSGTIEGDFTLPSEPAVLFVFSPIQGHGFSGAEAQQVSTWLSSGGVLVYAAEQAEPQLEAQLSLHRGGTRSYGNGPASQTADAPSPIFAGVGQVKGGDPTDKFIPAPTQVPLLRNQGGEVIGVRSAVGQGQVIALTDPLILCNGYLGQADNGLFAADLMALVPAGGRVLFDEFHHGAAPTGAAATAWVGTPWGAAVIWAAFVIFAGVALRGRGFGPALSLQSSRERSSAEYAVAVGSLLHRTGAGAVTLETLVRATRRAIAERIGLGAGTLKEDFTQAVAQRAPAVSAELARIETSLLAATRSEASLMETARRLHHLAYPLASNLSEKESG